MSLLHCADLMRLGFSRRAALKFAREMGAPSLAINGRADFVTTARAVELWLTLPTLRRAAARMPLDPLEKAAIEMAAAVQLEHSTELEKIRTAA